MALPSLRGRDLRSKATHPLDLLWDARLRVRTFGYTPARGRFESPHWEAHYTPTTYHELFRMLRRVRIGPADVFVDLGSGLGRAVFVAHRLGAAAAIGVEINERLHLQALANRERARLSPQRVRFVHCDAARFDPSDATVFFIYNAFGRATLRAFLDRLADGMRASPRHVRIVYFCPTLDDEVAATGFLRRFERWTEPPERHPVSFWETSSDF